MKISEIGEFGLIERLKDVLRSGIIGDDTAPVQLGGSLLLLTCDVLLQDRHFKLNYPPSAIGWKAISVNVSDVVANGGIPFYTLVSLVLPDMEVKYIEEIYLGIKRACEFYGCEVVGGNVSKGDKLCIDVFMIGKADKFVGRKGSKVGNGVFVSGTLGDSKAGLELLLMDKKSYEDFELRLIEKHLRPTARIDFVKHKSKYATASMDISDGLSSDALKLAKASSVKVRFNMFLKCMFFPVYPSIISCFILISLRKVILSMFNISPISENSPIKYASDSYSGFIISAIL